MKLIYATLAGFITLAVLGILWFGVIGMHFAPNVITSTSNPEGGVPLHILGDLVMALFMAIIYPMGYKGGTAMKEGAKFGLLIGLITELPASIHMYAGGIANIQSVVFFILYGIIMVPIAGIVIAKVYGGQKTAA